MPDTAPRTIYNTEHQLFRATVQAFIKVPNVAKNFRFGGKDYPFYEGYLGWGP